MKSSWIGLPIGSWTSNCSLTLQRWFVVASHGLFYISGYSGEVGEGSTGTDSRYRKRRKKMVPLSTDTSKGDDGWKEEE